MGSGCPPDREAKGGDVQRQPSGRHDITISMCGARKNAWKNYATFIATQ